MVDEDDVVLDAPQIWTVLRSVGVQEVRVCQLSDEVRDLWSHPVLLAERLVGISLQDKTFEERSVEI